MKQRNTKLAVVAVGILFFSLGTSVMAQRAGSPDGARVTTARGEGTRGDSLRGLRRALSEAGALALTTTQEEQLNTLIQAYRDGLPDGPSDALQAAYDAYDAAILAGNQAAANAQAAVIANLQATANNARLQGEATFKLAVIALLKTNGDQAGLLRQKFGDEGFLRILSSLTGGGRHR